MKRTIKLLATGAGGLLASVPAQAEMNKGASMGTALWGIFLLLVGVPLLMGFGLHALVAYLTGRQPNRLVVVLMAFGSWWGGIMLIWQSHETGQSSSGLLWLVLGSVALTATIAYLSADEVT